MQCPNCKLPFVEEKDEKFLCSTCGWLVRVGKEWQGCEAPEPLSEPSPEPQSPPETSPEPLPELDPAELEPDPAALEPDPASLEPDPAALEPYPHSVKSYLGGLITITEVDE